MLGLDVISFSISMSLLFFYLLVLNQKKKKKKSREKMRNFYFFILIAFQILYMFLPDISAHCALIEYAYI
jgi:magnesium-transporting ATPase (P-type)